MKLTNSECKQILDAAFLAAVQAANQKINDNPGVWYPCGFAWVTIKPARGSFVKYLKDHNIGHTDAFYGGYRIHDPAGLTSQWIEAKIDGAKAFAKVLTSAGIKCVVDSMID